MIMLYQQRCNLISAEPLNPTDGWGLQQKGDDAEEVHVSVKYSELYEDHPCVWIQPFVHEQILEGAVNGGHNEYM